MNSHTMIRLLWLRCSWWTAIQWSDYYDWDAADEQPYNDPITMTEMQLMNSHTMIRLLWLRCSWWTAIQWSDYYDWDAADEQPYNDPITVTEMLGALGRCRRTAPGEDSISYPMLQNLHNTSRQNILRIFNIIYQQQVYPEQWKTAIVLSFHKTGKPPNEASSYRP